MSESLPKCFECENDLDDEEVASPETDEDGNLLCDGCWQDIHMDTCLRCEETVEKSELGSKPGELIAIWENDAPGMRDDIKAGYYRVKQWPFFADGMIEGYFINSALEFVAALDEKGVRARANACHAGGALCQKCRDEIAKRLQGGEG